MILQVVSFREGMPYMDPTYGYCKVMEGVIHARTWGNLNHTVSTIDQGTRPPGSKFSEGQGDVSWYLGRKLRGTRLDTA